MTPGNFSTVAAVPLLLLVFALVAPACGSGTEPESAPDGADLTWLPAEHRAPFATAQALLREANGADRDAMQTLGGIAAKLDPEQVPPMFAALHDDLALALGSTDGHASLRAALLINAALQRLPEGPTGRAVRAGSLDDLVAAARASTYPAVRSGSVHMLAALGGEHRRDEILEMFADPEAGIRANAALCFGKLATASHTEVLATLYHSESDPRVRAAVLTAFGSRPILRGAAPALERHALERGTEPERLQALANLAQHGDHHALPLILLVLDTGSRRERDAALTTLMALKDPQARERLEAYREVEMDEDLRKKAAQVLRALR